MMRVVQRLPIVYIVSIAISAIGETWAYYLLLSVAESALLLVVIWYAWTWPRRVRHDDQRVMICGNFKSSAQGQGTCVATRKPEFSQPLDGHCGQ